MSDRPVIAVTRTSLARGIAYGVPLPDFDYARGAMAPVLASLIILAGLAVFAWILSYRVRPLFFGRRGYGLSFQRSIGPYSSRKYSRRASAT